MKYLKCLILIALCGVASCLSQNNIQSNDCGEKRSDRYTLIHNDSIVNFTQACFPGGEEELEIFIKKNIRSNSNLNGRVYNETLYIRLTISEKGNIEEYAILKHINDCNICDSITVNMIKSMPLWIPAYGIYKNGEKRDEKDQVIFPVKF